MRKTRSLTLALLLSAGIAMIPANAYAYSYTGGTKPASSSSVTISWDPAGAWNEDKDFSNDSKIFTVNSPTSNGSYTVGQEITLSVTPHKYYNTILSGGFSTNLADNFVMTILKGDSIVKSFKVNYYGSDLDKTFTDSFTPTEEGTYKINIFFRGSTASGSNYGNYYIQVVKAATSTSAKTGSTVNASDQTYKVLTSSTVAFTKAPNKASVTVPDNVKINGKAYQVTSIAPNAFAGMKNLTSIVIGKNVKSIGKNAFKGCSKLKKITIKTIKLTKKSIGANAFKGIHKKAVFKCPKAKKATYKSILLKKGAKKAMTFK